MTSPSVDDPQALHRILARAGALFLDFDGPVCNLFAGLPTSVVVDQLCVVLADGGYGEPPPEIEKSTDPFDVLKYAATLGETEARYINAALTACEVEAATAAQPTPGAHELIRTWSRTGRPLAIVSNNSNLAVETYVDLHALHSYVSYVSARTSYDPSILKPNPYLLDVALSVLNVPAASTAFIGDSVSDIKAARISGMVAVGYANRPGKKLSFLNAQADTIIQKIVGLPGP